MRLDLVPGRPKMWLQSSSRSRIVLMTDQKDWPDELDALIAAPKHHALMFENAAVRVLDTRVPPRNTVPLHTHKWPGVLYILSWSDFVRRDASGSIVVDTRLTGPFTEGSTHGSAPLPPHTLENVGESELRVISVELKNGV